MRFHCRKKNKKRYDEWHLWFAWRPVTLIDNETCVWLEVIWCKGTHWCDGFSGDSWWTWEYSTYLPEDEF